MEFDVVLLSAVRTPDRSRLREDADERVNARRLFGHLCSSNRLNVSMSRQRKLLVVVGDPGLVEGDLAANHISGLVDFYRISKKIFAKGHPDARS
jgi:superfamily I DNA and/or RNA helicase